MLTIIKPACTYVIGTAREIRSLYKNLEAKTSLVPRFADAPKFNRERIYGIQITENDEYCHINDGTYMVVGETDICYLLMGEVIEKGDI